MLSNGEEIVAEIPLEHLEIYRHYYRPGKIIRLGAKCVCCLKPVTHILALKENNKTNKSGVRFALYTEDWVELTIDHITPRFKGGKDSMKNYQVLCLFCNRTKGSTDISIDALREKLKNLVKNVL